MAISLLPTESFFQAARGAQPLTEQCLTATPLEGPSIPESWIMVLDALAPLSIYRRYLVIQDISLVL